MLLSLVMCVIRRIIGKTRVHTIAHYFNSGTCNSTHTYTHPLRAFGALDLMINHCVQLIQLSSAEAMVSL